MSRRSTLGRAACSPARAAALFAVLAAAAPAWAPAWADVLQIAPDGAVTTFAKPAIVTSEGVRVIAPDTPRPPSDTRRAPLAQTMSDAGAGVELSPLLIEAVAWAESRFNTQARSPAGAIGVMQLMPGTAADLGVDPHNPAQNIHGGARYLRQMLVLFNGDIELALAAYNAGPDAVRRYNGVPPYRETRAYVAAVLDYMAARTQEDAPR